MKQLRIEGVIAMEGDAELAAGGATFTPEKLAAFLDANGGEPFEALINSPGGSVEAGFKIYQMLKPLGITTVAEKANSIASVIFLAGKTRKIYEDAEMIIHNAWLDPQSLEGEKLNFHTVKLMGEFFAKTDMKILEVYAGVAGEDKTAALAGLMAQDTDLGSAKALSLGFATEVIKSKAPALAFRNLVITYSAKQLKALSPEETVYSDAVVVNSEGAVLMLKRKAGDDFEPLKWGLPGGKVEPGEDVAAAAARELYEETGLDIKLERLAAIENPDGSTSHYFAGTADQDPTATPEHDAWQWAKSADGLEVIAGQIDRFNSLINQTLTKLGMDNKEKLGAFERALKGLFRALKFSAKNMSVTTSEGVELFIPEGDGEGGLVGKAAYIAEEGLPSEVPAPAGSHTLSDGTTIVVGEGGLITEATAAADPEALKATFDEEKKGLEEKIGALEEEKTDLQNQVKNLTEKAAATEKAAKALEAQFNALKNQVLGDPEDKSKKPAIPSKEEWAKLPAGERIRRAAMNRATL